MNTHEITNAQEIISLVQSKSSSCRRNNEPDHLHVILFSHTEDGRHISWSVYQYLHPEETGHYGYLATTYQRWPGSDHTDHRSRFYESLESFYNAIRGICKRYQIEKVKSF